MSIWGGEFPMHATIQLDRCVGYSKIISMSMEVGYCTRLTLIHAPHRLYGGCLLPVMSTPPPPLNAPKHHILHIASTYNCIFIITAIYNDLSGYIEICQFHKTSIT